MFKLANELLQKINTSLTSAELQPCLVNATYDCSSGCDSSCDGSCTEHCLKNTDFW